MTAEAQQRDPGANTADEPAFAYDAFISYRRIEPDASVAARLHSLLESFRAPSGRSKLRVCLDREEFVAASSLPEEIRHRVLASRFLIVLCTPVSAASQWVQAEVQTFIDAGRKEQILLVLVSGEPRDAFPPALGLDFLAADLRAASSRQRWRKLETEKLRLLAPMLGCDFADLQNREERRQAQRLRNIAAGSLAVATLFGVVAAIAVWQRSEAVRQRAVAEQRMEQALGIAEKVLWDIDQHLMPVVGASTARADIARTILEALESLEPKNSSDPSAELEWKRTVARLRLAGFLEGNSSSEKAESAYREVQARAQALLDIDSESRGALQVLADVQAALARLSLYRGELEAAGEHVERQLEIARRLATGADVPAEDAYRLIDPLRQLADIQQRGGDDDAARTTLLRAEHDLNEFLARQQQSRELRHQLALIHEDLAFLAFRRRDSSEMLQRHRAAMEILETLLAEQPDAATKIALAKVYEQFGFMARFSERIDLELSYFGKAWNLIWPAFLGEPQNLGFRERLFIEAGELGDASYRNGDLNAALSMFQHRVLMGLAIYQQDPSLEAPLRRLIAARRVYAEGLLEARQEKAADKQFRAMMRELGTLVGREHYDAESHEAAAAALETLAAWNQAQSPELAPKIAEIQEKLDATAVRSTGAAGQAEN